MKVPSVPSTVVTFCGVWRVLFCRRTGSKVVVSCYKCWCPV